MSKGMINIAKWQILIFTAVFLFLSFGQAYSEVIVNYDSNIPGNSGTLIRVATDSSGLLYVSSPSMGKILVFTPNGQLLREITGLTKPIAVSVDDTGRIYVGVGNVGNRSVSVLNPDGQFLFSLGSGDGEFGLPGDIAIANGLVYVTDSINKDVKVYGLDGMRRFSFGGATTYPDAYGNLIPLTSPTGIAVDTAKQELYVSDTDNARVLIFDLNGNYKRYLQNYTYTTTILDYYGNYVTGDVTVPTKPHGIAIHEGRVYIADIYQNKVITYDTNGNFVTLIGELGIEPGELNNPMDAVMVGSKLYVTNTSNARIEVYKVLDSNSLAINPASLSFTSMANSIPPAQTVTVESQIPGNAIGWTATTTASFIRLSQSSGTTPSPVDISIDPAGLSGGTYTGTVTFRSQVNGTTVSLNVSLTVIQARLVVSPLAIGLYYQKNGSLPSANASIGSDGTSLQWSATVDATWLSLSSSSNTTPATLNIAVNQDAESLPEGTHIGIVTVSASSAVDSLQNIVVTLNVADEGTIIVKTNLINASFKLTGPSATYTGSGKEWRNEQAKAGNYEIAFDHVSGYRRPAIRAVEIESGNVVTVDVQYQPLPVANVIVAGKGPSLKNDAKVRIFDLAGNIINEFTAFATMFGANVATGDIDGDGISEIIAASGQGSSVAAFVKIFRYDGALLTSTGSIANTIQGAIAASGDIDGDGKYEMVMSTLNKDALTQNVIIYAVDTGYRLVEKSRLTFRSAVKLNSPAKVAFGDVNGDGRLELIVSRQDDLGIYVFDSAMTPSLLSNTSTTGLLSVAAGDINDEGIDRVIVGYGDGISSFVKVLNPDLTDSGTGYTAFDNGKVSPNISSMDWDGDGIIEILNSKGPHKLNNGAIRIFGANGALLREITAFTNIESGVNAAFGVVR